MPVTERKRTVRRKRLRKPSRRINRMLLAMGITGLILACGLWFVAARIDQPMLRTAALVYLFLSVAAICWQQLRRHIYQIRKRKLSGK